MQWPCGRPGHQTLSTTRNRRGLVPTQPRIGQSAKRKCGKHIDMQTRVRALVGAVRQFIISVESQFTIREFTQQNKTTV